ncbi:unnamed protein product [Nyctereutes procyonoides]|uniref:(raccoon dog) hypothetical protein n=1 Tax=Nyctereutes procyonoides TaxID=34880 RepID=A0A811YJ54_NYCPR|nr:unnamed protein product [Nyctereutes procyonoides]
MTLKIQVGIWLYGSESYVGIKHFIYPLPGRAGVQWWQCKEGLKVHVRPQAPPRAAVKGSGGSDDEGPYNHKELWNLKELLEQLTHLYDCQEEEIPELETDMDELLDTERDDAWMAKVKSHRVDLKTY